MAAGVRPARGLPYRRPSSHLASVRGADLPHIVSTPAARAPAILWEARNTRHWSDAWIGKLQMAPAGDHADVAVLVTAACQRV